MTKTGTLIMFDLMSKVGAMGCASAPLLARNGSGSCQFQEISLPLLSRPSVTLVCIMQETPSNGFHTMETMV